MPTIDRRSFLTHVAGAAAAVALFPEVLPGAVRMPGGPMPIGVVGYGRQGRKLTIEVLDRLGDAAKVAAVCDRSDSRAQSGAGRAPGALAFSDHRAMLDGVKELGAVFIATPTHEHKRVALDAIAAGKHVYCETPLAHTQEDCLEIARAARASKVVFASALEGRSNPVYTLARSFCRTDAVRDMVALYAQNHQKTTWGRPGDWWLDPSVSLGLPGEWGVQQLDVWSWFRGSHPMLAEGYGSTRLHQDGRQVHDTVRCTLRWPDGVEGVYSATQANSFGGRHETFHAVNAAIKVAWSHGWMFKEADSPQLGFEVYANRQQFHNDEGITLIADATKLASQGKLKEGVGLPNPPHSYALADFFKAIGEGKPPAATASDGARATIVAIAAATAVRSGNAVAIDPEVLQGA
jgi:predicted dehydrogenase